DRSNPNLVYAVTQYGAELYRTADGGENWAVVRFATTTGMPGRPRVHSVVADTLRAYRVWAISEAGLLRSDDGGRTWSVPLAMTQGGWVSLFAASPVVPDRVFAGVDGGLAVSSDGGDHWALNSFPEAVGLLVPDSRDSSVVLAVGYTTDPLGLSTSHVYR